MINIEYAYNQFCEEPFNLPTEKQIAELEERIGVTFPASYRRFISKYNGGFFTEPLIQPSSDECPEDCLNCMNGIGASHPTAELGSAADLVLFEDNNPLEILPIGYTLMGGLIVLFVSGEFEGTIMLKVAFGKSHFLAEDIDEFFGLLRKRPDQE